MKKFVAIIQKIPAYIMTVPLFLGIMINLILDASMSEGSYKSYTDVVGTISTVLMAILVFGVCSQLNFRKLGKSFVRGGVLLIYKFAISALIGVSVGLVFGPAGFLGISALAIVAGMSNANTALFAGISQTYGEEPDTPSLMVLCLCNSPAFTLIVLVASGLAQVDFIQLLLPIIPMALGILVGNIWPKIQPILYKSALATLPVFALLLGTTISLLQALQGGAQGLLLGLATLILTGLLAFFVSRVYMGKGKYSPMAAGLGTTAGTAIMTPAFIASIGGAAEEIAASATAQIAGSMIFTAALAPVLVAMLFRYEQKRRKKRGVEQIVTAAQLIRQ